MSVAPFDEHDRPGRDLDASAVYECATAPRNNVKPLVGAAVAVVGTAFRVAWKQHHLCRLCVPVPKYDPKACSEA